MSFVRVNFLGKLAESRLCMSRHSALMFQIRCDAHTILLSRGVCRAAAYETQTTVIQRCSWVPLNQKHEDAVQKRPPSPMVLKV